MQPADAAILLAKCAAFDNRTVGRADAEAWAEALDDVRLPDALAAVTVWYRDNRERIMPADVRRLVAEARHNARRALRMDHEDAQRQIESSRAVPFEDAPPEARELIAAFRAQQARRPGRSRAVVRLAHVLRNPADLSQKGDA